MVTVILPSYNHAKYLRERIDSILNQTYQDFELIILDDKSPDESGAVIESYRGHERISHIIINEVNTGNTFAQWDRGFELAKGDYIWIAESDDYAAPTFLERCVAALESNKKAVLSFADSHFVDENSQIITPKKLEKLVMPVSGVSADGTITYSGEEIVRRRLLRHNYLYNASMILFRKSALKGVSGYYKTLRGCGDWAFWGEMVMRGDVVRVAERLSYFRQHTNKVTTRLRDNKIGFFESANVLAHLLTLYTQSYGGQRDKFRLNATIGNTTKRARGVVLKYAKESDHDRESVARTLARIDALDTRSCFFRFIHKSISKRQFD